MSIDGYGAFSVGNKIWRAHRLAYALYHGQADLTFYVCHTCDVRNCVNPEHLRCGSAKENAEDKILRGRVGGESHSQAKLSKAQIIEIFKLRGAGRTCTSIGRQFGVSKQLVSFIGTGRHHWFELGLKPMFSRKASMTTDRSTKWTIEDAKRFWSKVRKTAMCWHWSGCTQRGYGAFRLHGKTLKAHRVAYLMSIGSLPGNKVISHTCADRLCVRPEHLEAVTPTENMQNPITRRRLSEARQARK